MPQNTSSQLEDDSVIKSLMWMSSRSSKQIVPEEENSMPWTKGSISHRRICRNQHKLAPLRIPRGSVTHHSEKQHSTMPKDRKHRFSDIQLCVITSSMESAHKISGLIGNSLDGNSWFQKGVSYASLRHVFLGQKWGTFRAMGYFWVWPQWGELSFWIT